MFFVLTGPESTGKTTLADALARNFSASLIPEAARTYLQGKPTYHPSDLLRIAALQQASERAASETPVIADTDLQVIYIWWQERFGSAPEILNEQYANQSERFYFLCKPDIPWQADPLRENALDRDRLFKIYEIDLQKRGLRYSVVEGKFEDRLSICVDTINGLLND